MSFWATEVEDGEEACPFPFCRGVGDPSPVSFELHAGEHGFKCRSCHGEFYVYQRAWA